MKRLLCYLFGHNYSTRAAKVTVWQKCHRCGRIETISRSSSQF